MAAEAWLCASGMNQSQFQKITTSATAATNTVGTMMRLRGIAMAIDFPGYGLPATSNLVANFIKTLDRSVGSNHAAWATIRDIDDCVRPYTRHGVVVAISESWWNSAGALLADADDYDC